jgi:hypothetical protein
MTEDPKTEVPTPFSGRDPQVAAAEDQRRRDLRRAIIFGVIMATIEMGLLLFFMYG